MFCFTRRAGQKLRIGDDIVLSVQRIRGGSVRLGFDVPADMAVDREEVAEVKKRDRIAANLKIVAEQSATAAAGNANPVARSKAKAKPKTKAARKKSAR